MMKLIEFITRIEMWFLAREYRKLRSYALDCDFDKRVSNFHNRYPEVTEFHGSWLPKMINKLKRELDSLGY